MVSEDGATTPVVVPAPPSCTEHPGSKVVRAGTYGVWAEAGEEVLTRQMENAQALMAERLDQDPAALMGSEASAGDVAFLMRPEVIAAFRRIVPEQARHGVGGSVDDTLAFAKDWSFDLSTIQVPVLVTYGAVDSSCPVAHGRFLAQTIPTAIAIEVADEGHFATDPRSEVLATHRWLRVGGVSDYPGGPREDDRR